MAMSSAASINICSKGTEMLQINTNVSFAVSQLLSPSSSWLPLDAGFPFPGHASVIKVLCRMPMQHVIANCPLLGRFMLMQKSKCLIFLIEQVDVWCNVAMAEYFLCPMWMCQLIETCVDSLSNRWLHRQKQKWVTSEIFYTFCLVCLPFFPYVM